MVSQSKISYKKFPVHLWIKDNLQKNDYKSYKICNNWIKVRIKHQKFLLIFPETLENRFQEILNCLNKFIFLWGNYYSPSWFLFPMKTYFFANSFQILREYTLFSTAVFVIYCIKLKFKWVKFNWIKISRENAFFSKVRI